MTAKRDYDELIRTFVQEGPAELSPRLIEGIRDDVHGTRQRAPRRPWRTFSMPRPILIFAVLGAIVVAFSAFLLVGPGGRVPGLPTPAPSAVPTPTPTPLFTPTPTFRPYPLADGEPWIVLASDSGGATLIRPDGAGSHEILGGLPVTVEVPNWSPDGRQIVFEGNGDRGSQVWVANADGTGARALTPTPDGCPNATCIEGVQPAWSPDGRSIAFIAPTHVAGTLTKTALVVLDVATGSTTELYTTTDATLARPSWSPDSRTIVIEVDRWSGTPEGSQITSTVIGVVGVAGADHTLKEITKASLLAGFPTWHPTEDLIVFRTNRYDAEIMQDDKAPSNLYTIHSDGTGLTAVTDNRVGGVIVRGPTWTSDGRIMFGRLSGPGAPELLTVIGADGTGETSATGSVETAGEGRWRPTP
jgi:dipeptidyl aminopeptidase/acylaminoacyl peptidase